MYLQWRRCCPREIRRDAFNHFSMKKNGRGVDGMQISELED